MAIEDILTALDEQACDECDKITADANAEAERILSEARDQAERIKNQRLERVKSVVEPKALQLVNAAKLSNKRDLESARMKAVDEVFDEAQQRLQQLRRDPQLYRPLMRSLLSEATANTNGDSEAVVDPADEALARELLSDLDVTCTLQAADTPYGGVTVLSCAGKVARRNTLDERLELVRSTGRAAVAEMLFG